MDRSPGKGTHHACPARPRRFARSCRGARPDGRDSLAAELDPPRGLGDRADPGRAVGLRRRPTDHAGGRGGDPGVVRGAARERRGTPPGSGPDGRGGRHPRPAGHGHRRRGGCLEGGSRDRGVTRARPDHRPDPRLRVVRGRRSRGGARARGPPAHAQPDPVRDGRFGHGPRSRIAARRVADLRRAGGPRRQHRRRGPAVAHGDRPHDDFGRHSTAMPGTSRPLARSTPDSRRRAPSGSRRPAWPRSPSAGPATRRPRS